ncbi:LOW QUALITY PROTEIN: EcsC protein [Geomicrobium sp. JCM 19037]|nr:LOW QUALITY PROTEIN: EcsC protein [Geomicrobium sp. JCM 19037]
MRSYEAEARDSLDDWKRKITRNPTMVKTWTKSAQSRLNSYIPDKVHQTIGGAVRQMIETTLNGSRYMTKNAPVQGESLEEREKRVDRAIVSYKRTASLEGAGTGAGGILLGMSDFPMLLAIKMRYLFTTATLYGYEPNSLEERLFLLHIFQMAFSSSHAQHETLARIERWDEFLAELGTIRQKRAIDWVTFQLEYRDFIDVPKTLQLIPGFGLFVGATINYQLLELLGQTAKQCYRVRWFKEEA